MKSRAKGGLCPLATQWRCVGRSDIALIDLREKSEREKHGVIPGSLHLPYPQLPSEIGSGGMLHELASQPDKRIVFYCAFGERSAMAVQAAQDAGLKDRVSHCRRHRRLEESKRTARALSFGLIFRRLQSSSRTHYQASVIISSISNPLP